MTLAIVNLFIADGRLGNQLFQLNCIRALGIKNIWLSGYEQSVSVVDPEMLAGIHYVNQYLAKLVSSKRFRSLLYICKAGLEAIGIKVISGKGLSAEAQLDELVYEVENDKGKEVTKAAIYMDLTMLGSDSYQAALTTHKEEYIRDELKYKAKMWFKERGLRQSECCFVHIRRSDYRSWPSESMNAILPIDYYRDAVKYIKRRSRVRDLKIIIASDEQVSLTTYGGNYLIDERPSMTFTILSMCYHGVMSPSTFSLAATLHGYERKSGGIFIAPMYWGGYKGDVWYPDKGSICFKEILYLSKEGVLASGLGS